MKYSIVSPPVVPYINAIIKNIKAKGDSGASNHYWRLADLDVFDELITKTGPTVALPDNTTLTSSQQGILPLSTELSVKAKTAVILDNLQSSSLISFGQLCDDDCEVLLQKKKCYVVKNKNIILEGTRNASDKLWDIDIPVQTPKTNYQVLRPTPSNSINVIIRKRQTKQDLATYLHAACFGPKISTLIRAVKNNQFTTWPGLTAKLLKQLPNNIITTELAHIDQERQNLQSTKLKLHTPDTVKQEEDEHIDDFFPLSNAPNVKTHDVAYRIIQFQPSGKAYVDLTGRFPYSSSRGNQYLMVGYHYDSNFVMAEAIKK